MHGCRLAAWVSLLGLALAGCGQNRMIPKSPAPGRDINAVLAAHTGELLARPGVVGVCVGLSPDGKTSCLKIMLARKDTGVERSLPRTLEGHPVVTEVTGEIKPLSPSQR